MIQRPDVLRAIIDHAPIGIWLLGADGRLQFVNRTWCRWVGIPEAEFLAAAHYSSLYDPATAARCQASDAEALARDGLHVSQETVRFADGRRHDLEIVKLRLAEPAGGVAGLIGLCLDVTERRATEERLRLLAGVFASAQEGIVICDPQGAIVDVNPSFTRITGWPREEVLGQNPRLLGSGRHRPEFFQEMWSSLFTQGRWANEIWNRRKDGTIYPEWLGITAVRDDEGRIARFVGVFSDITRLKRQEEELQRLAHHDALTGLPNRVLLADRMGQAIALTRRTGKLLAVAYLDLDAFKPVNDRFGHDRGDALLQEIARRLVATLRSGDTVARLGGDEFVLLLPDLESIEECEVVLGRVLTAVPQPAALPGTAETVKVSASIGVSIYPHDETDPDELLRHADQAMYQAKREGRNRYHLFDPVHDVRVRARRARVERLREALVQGEFVLHYQPKVNLRSGRFLGVEGLARWRHPERGLLAPAEFLPDLDGTDVEIAFGEWAIGTALAQLEAWRGQGLDTVACINVCGRHLLSEGFVAQLQRLFAAHPTLGPGHLQLEVLESVALADLFHAGDVLDTCRRLGVSFAIDDFGTGYSSLTYLRRLPVDVLKIDSSFVLNMLHDPGDLVIVDGVVALAEAFGRSVVAEGVETAQHGLALLRLGCEAAQGYGIARPMPPEEVPSWVERWRPDPSWVHVDPHPWTAADFPLLVGEQQHVDWLDQLLAWARAPERVSAPPLDEQTCPIGRWIHGAGRLRHGRRPEFAEVEEAHAVVHRGARELASHAPLGAGGLAAEEAALRARCLEFLERVRALQRAVARETGLGEPGPA